MFEKSLKKSANFPYNARTSYQRDIENWPKPNEGDLMAVQLSRKAPHWVFQLGTESIYSGIRKE